ncbi:uncharacterized protein LOC131157685 isoform X2 [Malania oleifera]|uniref:uncharacterized protein LOC131157685 isoform X2 n=1 Tax=Malania oleifera TaxID=397392 RepID=UPI0025ADC4B5|nr:uncharacterized protein LOC131157685 isoform X2 [Malania oleifera]
MESWLPLFDIFMNSPSPEAEASMWLQRSFDASSTATPITTNSFLSLLTKPSDAIVLDSSSSSSSSSAPHRKRVMWIQTLPNAVQSRILSFLVYDRQRFCAQDLCKLARNILSESRGLDFWVEKAARHLLDFVSESNYRWISNLSLDSAEERVDEEFESLPDWLKEAAGTSDVLLPWLHVSSDELDSRACFSTGGDDSDSLADVGEDEEEKFIEVEPVVKTGSPTNAPLDPEIKKMAACLKSRILTYESTSVTVGLANEIHELCFNRGADAFAVLGLIEPWNTDDETASILISHLSNGSEEELGWPSQVLCSIILPKLFMLDKPASRVLVTSIIEYCRRHQRAAVYALLFPLILRDGGINHPICDVITRIIRECLHPAHVSAFCQKLLCGDVAEERKIICLPCHKCVISNELPP